MFGLNSSLEGVYVIRELTLCNRWNECSYYFSANLTFLDEIREPKFMGLPNAAYIHFDGQLI
uniref:Uncharacterized protein n=1 Tax=Romanomermis culicivorax TaxID=13658 RepID=A0A915HU10_ROMCU